MQMPYFGDAAPLGTTPRRGLPDRQRLAPGRRHQDVVSGVAAAHCLEVETTEIFTMAPSAMNRKIMLSIESAAPPRRFPAIEMLSGALDDAMVLARHVLA